MSEEDPTPFQAYPKAKKPDFSSDMAMLVMCLVNDTGVEVSVTLSALPHETTYTSERLITKTGTAIHFTGTEKQINQANGKLEKIANDLVENVARDMPLGVHEHIQKCFRLEQKRDAQDPTKMHAYLNLAPFFEDPIKSTRSTLLKEGALGEWSKNDRKTRRGFIGEAVGWGIFAAALGGTAYGADSVAEKQRRLAREVGQKNTWLGMGATGVAAFTGTSALISAFIAAKNLFKESDLSQAEEATRKSLCKSIATYEKGRGGSVNLKT